jgi:hypothetical protein
LSRPNCPVSPRAGVFAPVVNDPDLTLNEKRAILASWASDARAVESVPELRRVPVEGGRPVPFDDVMDALRVLDARVTETSSRYHRVVRKRRIFSHGSDQSGPTTTMRRSAKRKRCLHVKALKSTAAFAIRNTRPDSGTGSGVDPRLSLSS